VLPSPPVFFVKGNPLKDFVKKLPVYDSLSNATNNENGAISVVFDAFDSSVIIIQIILCVCVCVVVSI
jgi:hypothetical protein